MSNGWTFTVVDKAREKVEGIVESGKSDASGEMR